MFIIFALSITKHIKKKEHINLRDHQNSAIDIAADTGSPVINDKRFFFRSDLKVFPFEMIERFFPQLQLILLLRIYRFGCPELSASVRKLAKTENILYGCCCPQQGFSGSGELLEHLIFSTNFFQKIQH